MKSFQHYFCRSKIVSAVITMCSSFVVAVLAYLIFKLVLNNQEAKLDLKIEKAKAGLVPAQKDLYSGTLEYLHFLLEFLLTTREIYLGIPTPKIVEALMLHLEHGHIMIEESGLSNSELNLYLTLPADSYSSLYKALVGTPEVYQKIENYRQVHDEKLSKLLITPEIKSMGEDLYTNIYTFRHSSNYFSFLDTLDSLNQKDISLAEDIDKIIKYNAFSMKELISKYQEMEKRFYELYEIS